MGARVSHQVMVKTAGEMRRRLYPRHPTGPESDSELSRESLVLPPTSPMISTAHRQVKNFLELKCLVRDGRA